MVQRAKLDDELEAADYILCVSSSIYPMSRSHISHQAAHQYSECPPATGGRTHLIIQTPYTSYLASRTFQKALGPFQITFIKLEISDRYLILCYT